MIQELKKLNRTKNLIVISIIIMFIVLISSFFFVNLSEPSILDYSILIIPVVIILILPVIMGYLYLRKVGKKILDPYVLSKCPFWKIEVSSDQVLQFTEHFIPSKDIMFSIVIPTYKIDKILLHKSFITNDAIPNKSIKEIHAFNIWDNISKSYNNRTNKPIQFYACVISAKIKNSKNLNSVTYFQTNNYPAKTDKKIIEEKSKLELPKIELPNATENNIDVYGNNPVIAKQLASEELFTKLQDVKKKFNLLYTRAIFYKNYVIFVLRHNRDDILDYPSFFIKIPWFKNIDHPLLEQAVNNFKTLTDLADKAPEFTKNI